MRLVSRSYRRRVHDLSDSSGQSIVEFALLLPFILVLLMGVFEVGRAWQKYQVITDAAREGARIAAVSSGDLTIDSAAVYQVIHDALARGTLDSTRATITFTGLKEGTGLPVQLQIDYPHDLFLVGSLLQRFGGQDPSPGGILLKSRVGFRNE